MRLRFNTLTNGIQKEEGGKNRESLCNNNGGQTIASISQKENFHFPEFIRFSNNIILQWFFMRAVIRDKNVEQGRQKYQKVKKK